MESISKHKRRVRAKLIFNPASGAADASPNLLTDVIRELQAWKIIAEPFLIAPECDLPGMIKDALAQGFRLFVVCGGDGTVSSVAHILANTQATLGIIPIGTQNNTALSLNIPNEIPAAIALLRTGRRIKVDVGMAKCGEVNTPFLEVCSVGLVSNLFPSVDDIQHGNLARVGDLLTTLATSPPAEIHLTLDGKQEIHNSGHVVLVSNMPYIGFHYQVGSPLAFNDGLLDVLYFADLSKIELLNYVIQGVGVGNAEDPRIQHFHVRRVEIETHPAMPVMVDGTAIGEGMVHIEAQHRVLAVMVGAPASDKSSLQQTEDAA